MAIFYHVVSHLGSQPLPEITKMAAMALRLKMEKKTNKIQTKFMCVNHSLTLNMFSAMLGGNKYQKSQKWSE